MSVPKTAAGKQRKVDYERERRHRVRNNTQPENFRVSRQTFNGEGALTSETRVHPGRTDDEVVHLPTPAVVARTSTLYGADGEVRAQWVIEKPEDKLREQQFLAWAEELTKDAPARPLVPLLSSPVLLDADLLTAYPVGDHHLGMLAWKHEVGVSNDIELAEALLSNAMSYLVSAAPVSEHAVVAVLGDFVHYDSFDSVTPTNRNLLDADGRAPKMISAGLRLLENVIEFAAQKHRFVHVMVELGNHDAYTSMIFARLLDRIYRDNPRVTVDINPSHFHYHEFGQNLIGTHHGHGRVAKPANLPGIMANDQREAWGRTKYHYWWTGHIHSQTVYEFPGCSVESFRILPPADAYAHNEGYRSKRDMKSIVLHREHGEVGRHVVNPSMLEGA